MTFNNAHLEKYADSDVDFLSGRRDAVEQRWVVQRAVPRGFASEKRPIGKYAKKPKLEKISLEFWQIRLPQFSENRSNILRQAWHYLNAAPTMPIHVRWVDCG